MSDMAIEYLLRELLAIRLYDDFRTTKDKPWHRLEEPVRASFRLVAERVGDGVPASGYRAFRSRAQREGMRNDNKSNAGDSGAPTPDDGG